MRRESAKLPAVKKCRSSNLRKKIFAAVDFCSLLHVLARGKIIQSEGLFESCSWAYIHTKELICT